MALLSGAEAIYEVADLFRERCLVAQNSLLWPDQSAWTLASLDALWAAFVERPDEGKRSFMDKWRDQLADQPPDVHRVATDVMAFYYLFPSNIGPAAKLHGVEAVISWKLVGEGEPPDLPRVREAFAHKIGHAGINYLTGRPSQIAFYLAFARRVLAGEADPFDAASCQALADAVQREVAGSVAARHILLHLLFPDRYERIASRRHKQRLLTAFADKAGESDDVDDALLSIQRAIAAERGVPTVDFYAPNLRPLWLPDKVDGAGSEDGGDEGEVEQGGGARTSSGGSLVDLVAATHLAPDELEEIAELLRDKRQLIFEGPPGSGKTYVAELFARWFADVPLGGLPDDRVELVQFHQSYGYEDFVQGIRPETDSDGRLTYRVRDGVFKRLCSLAATRQDQKFVLIVDEINRGNVARIFGELLLLLEYRDKRARLPYAPADAGDEAYLAIPDNLYLIGTMNSTDRSLAQVDYALRRRFYFVRFEPVTDGRAPILEGWLRKNGVTVVDCERIVQLFVTLNSRVQERLGPDFQVGHSYFMSPAIHTPQGLNRVWRRAIGPLLAEYFHAHRDRDALLAEMTPARLLAATEPRAFDNSDEGGTDNAANTHNDDEPDAGG